MVCTFWVNQHCEQIIESKRFTLHRVQRKSVYDKDHTFEIAPKVEKVNKHIRQRTLELEAAAQELNLSVDDGSTPSPGNSHQRGLSDSLNAIVSSIFHGS